MNLGESFRTYLTRVEEAQVYLDQGLADFATEVLQGILDDLRDAPLSEFEKSDLRSRIESCLGNIATGHGASTAAPEVDSNKEISAESRLLEAFQYGLVLMDGQFWEEAIEEFKRAAVFGENILKCWELCGDCAGHLERWAEAIRYYEMVYTDPAAEEDLKRDILLKITKCSQTHKKITAKSSLAPRPGAERTAPDITVDKTLRDPRVEPLVASFTSPDQTSVIQLLGQEIASWQNNAGEFVLEEPRHYRVRNMLHVGVTSLVVELEEEGTDRRLAGQSITAPFNRFLSPQALAKWVRNQLMTDSRHLLKVFDLAHFGDLLFIVREYLPLTLLELFSVKQVLPMPLAVSIGHRVLEGLGDLHLRMGKDEVIRSIYHLDLRPSRILLDVERPVVKISNGGLWAVLQASSPSETSVRNLPLPLLAYRAPEQFRPYLARKKPPLFTDIYLFGALFYEMLTGIPAFNGSSYEEYEIQHCEQYPTPPKVWRSEIPEELNDLIMKCLERDPFKRWRSTTQMSLILDKSFNHLIHSMKGGSLKRFLEEAKPD
jgi:eukaryotic-like serine/threonine-protein kinase